MFADRKEAEVLLSDPSRWTHMKNMNDPSELASMKGMFQIELPSNTVSNELVTLLSSIVQHWLGRKGENIVKLAKDIPHLETRSKISSDGSGTVKILVNASLLSQARAHQRGREPFE